MVAPCLIGRGNVLGGEPQRREAFGGEASEVVVALRLPRRVMTKWSPHALLGEGTCSAVNPNGAKHSAVNRLSRFTPSRFPVKLLMPTICRSISKAAGN